MVFLLCEFLDCKYNRTVQILGLGKMKVEGLGVLWQLKDGTRLTSKDTLCPHNRENSLCGFERIVVKIKGSVSACFQGQIHIYLIKKVTVFFCLPLAISDKGLLNLSKNLMHTDLSNSLSN